MRPLERAEMVRKSREEIRAMARSAKIPFGDMRRLIKDIEQNETVWKNDIYTVNVRDFGDYVHLSIKRNDRAPATDWRHKQQIKNQLVGPECEGVEIYPAESRLIDTANQFHLWVVKDPSWRVPFGFNEGRKVSNAEFGGSKQRRLDN